MKIAIIGAGSVGTNLHHAFALKGVRTELVHARPLTAQHSNDQMADDQMVNGFDVYIYAVADQALREVIAKINAPKALHLHTSGSMPIEVFGEDKPHSGIMYFFQSFSRDVMIDDWSGIPCFISGHNIDDIAAIYSLAQTLTGRIYEATQHDRERLHVAGVFANNFSNLMYRIAAEILRDTQIPFEALLPLIDRTAEKVHTLAPKDAQTFITHAFTPFSLSVVLVKAESENLLDKAEEYPQLIKILAGNEFVPSVGYNFIYNDYRAKRTVNTMLDLGVKESGNLINALYCLFGQKWNDPKKLGGITFNRFVKLSAELRNKFNLTEQVCIATRLFAGANIPLGNSSAAPLSEAFYTGGPNSLRATSPSSYGPGNFYSAKYNQPFFHAGDVKLEANFELRFPIVWKLYGAAFVDAGNVWNWTSTADLLTAAGLEDYKSRMELSDDLHDGILNNPDWARQIALGTGAGLRLDIDGLVIRLDIGVGIHAPYQTFKYDKDGNPDKTQPISTYFNIPSALDALRVNFGIGYPF